MTDRRLQDIEEGKFEDIIRGLPAREPGPDLRARVLSHSRVRTRRGWTTLRPALAAALVVALLAIDVLVLKFQDGGLHGASSSTVVASSPKEAVDADATWLAQVLDEAGPARMAWLRADATPGSDKYAALRASLLTIGPGG